MLVFHSAYTYDHIKNYGLDIFVTSRDASGLFDIVYTVSPVANLQYPRADIRNFTPPEIYRLDSRNEIIEGKTSRFRIIRHFKRINFCLAQVSLLISIFKLIPLKRISIIRSEDPRLNGVYGYIFSKILKVPFIVGVWGNPGRLRELNNRPNMPNLFKSMIVEEKIEKFILKRASAVMAQNYENLSYATNSGVPLHKSHILPLGAGIAKCHFQDLANRLDVSKEIISWDLDHTFNLICISRLEKLKMVDHAIRAASSLNENKVQFKLLIVGDGSELDNLKKLVVDLGMTNSIIFTGNRSQEWIAGVLKYIDVNVAPLCGRSLLEASLGGLPAVAYDVDWHNEIVFNGITGFLLPNLNFRAMGDSLLELFKNPENRVSMGLRMKSVAWHLANPSQIALKQRLMYQSLLKERTLSGGESK